MLAPIPLPPKRARTEVAEEETLLASSTPTEDWQLEDFAAAADLIGCYCSYWLGFINI